ncbi:MAG: hypothetical protein JXM74_00590 [Fusobacteriaceae bacterium]|nr:hypothetical protein [Fusobacteriaceae bacterium]MBN2837234.1 hypothetical protein [Fusobacteriaceae bacterium]
MKKILIFAILCFSVFSKDIQMEVKEDVLNKFLVTAGSFSGENKINLKVGKVNVNWKVYDAKIKLAPTSNFNAKIDIITNGKTQKGTVEGKVKFQYLPTTQILKINVEDMKIKNLGVYNALSLYKPKYDLPLKMIQMDKIEVKKNSSKKVFLQPVMYDSKVTILEKKVLVESNVKFVESK